LGSGLAFTLGMIVLSTCSALPSSGDSCARRLTPTAEDVVEGGSGFFVGSLIDGIRVSPSAGDFDAAYSESVLIDQFEPDVDRPDPAKLRGTWGEVIVCWICAEADSNYGFVAGFFMEAIDV
jgi:hypothetical protein